LCIAKTKENKNDDMSKSNEKTARRGNFTIVLDILEENYSQFVADSDYAKQIIDEWISKDVARKIFPNKIHTDGYSLKGKDRLVTAP
jgi:hypothetical protein